MAPFNTLRLDRVTRRFGHHTALSELDLEIQGGEFIALLGPSGCGKSTALNCLAGLLPLTSGSIHLDGRRIDHLPPERRGFGMVFQNYALFPHLTVRGNVAFGLKMARKPKAEIARLVPQALSLVQLTDQAGKRPGQLSGGQQQRVAIARAIVLEPRLVLMDEPLSNLDAKLRLEMRTEIRRLHQSLGLTTVYVTHDQEEALSLADRLVVLRDGRVQQIGSGEEVYTEPANRYVAGFMGYRNMLSLPVTRADGPDAVVAVGSDTVAGRNRDGLTAGNAAVVALRPEDVEVTGGESGFAATVEVVQYHGRELAVQGRLADGQEIHFTTHERLAPGDAVRLAAPVERVLVFAASEGDGAVSAKPADGDPDADSGEAADDTPDETANASAAAPSGDGRPGKAL